MLTHSQKTALGAAKLLAVLLVGIASLLLASAALPQESSSLRLSVDMPKPTIKRNTTKTSKPTTVAEVLFALSDTAVTWSNLHGGGRELNLPWVHNGWQMAGTQVGFHAVGWGLVWLGRKTGHPWLAELPKLYLVYGNAEGFVYSLEHKDGGRTWQQAQSRRLLHH